MENIYYAWISYLKPIFRQRSIIHCLTHQRYTIAGIPPGENQEPEAQSSLSHGGRKPECLSPHCCLPTYLLAGTWDGKWNQNQNQRHDSMQALTWDAGSLSNILTTMTDTCTSNCHGNKLTFNFIFHELTYW